MNQDTWQYQGRQQHGEWGHGTAPHADQPTRPDVPAPATIEGRAMAAAHGVIGRLTRSDAGFYESRLHNGMLDNFQQVAAAHPATASLDDEAYREEILDHVLTPTETGHLRRAAAITHDARTLNQLAPATAAMAALLDSAGLPIMDKGLATAAFRLAAYRSPAAVLNRNARSRAILAFAGPSTAAPLAQSLLDLGVPSAVIEFAGPVAFAAAALAMTGILSPRFDPRFTVDPVRSHPEARAVVDWSKRRIAIAVPDPAGGAPGTIGLAMIDHYENGHLTEVLRDRDGAELGTRGAWGTITLNPLGEEVLAKALADRPRASSDDFSLGSIFETRTQEERDLVERLWAEGKTYAQIQTPSTICGRTVDRTPIVETLDCRLHCGQTPPDREKPRSPAIRHCGPRSTGAGCGTRITRPITSSRCRRSESSGCCSRRRHGRDGSRTPPTI